MVELLKDLHHVMAMFDLVPGINEDVMYVDDDESLEEFPKHHTHIALEDCG